MPHMPEKAPSFRALVLTALRENGLAMGLTFALTWLRIQYDGKEAKPRPSAHRSGAGCADRHGGWPDGERVWLQHCLVIRYGYTKTTLSP